MPTVGLTDWHRSGDFAPLMLVMSGQEECRLVRSLREVADALINAWPTDDGVEYIAAVKTCVDAILGNIQPKIARAALIRAAQEAEIPVIAVVQ
ncbi:DUF982 domain-containing protein [Rhizobium leguminosarum]|uniref:DUF982 domain-containing protein n=1 Tax=Rhizobium leguminosarum TaxID=384 RepID=A0A7M3DW56_RHILE|nr:DUF982 domain-containing protein [Rhizobium leguminosarum]TAY52897.1 DUF982 domain-containing protein [Rhizobium leguminosarum]